MNLDKDDLEAIEQIVVRVMNTTPVPASVGASEPTIFDFVRQAQGPEMDPMPAGQSWEGVARANRNVAWFGKPALLDSQLDACWREVEELKKIKTEPEWRASLYGAARPETAAWALLNGVVYPPALIALQAPRLAPIAGDKTIAAVIDELIARAAVEVNPNGPGPGGF